MKLYLLTQIENRGYDTFDSAIVAAYNEVAATKISPGGKNYWKTSKEDCYPVWAKSPETVNCEYLGEAKEGTEQGLILGSFNAG